MRLNDGALEIIDPVEFRIGRTYTCTSSGTWHGVYAKVKYATASLRFAQFTQRSTRITFRFL